MTILCLVRNLKDGSWAAFSDCLITSDEQDSGPALEPPIRVNRRIAGTIGFAEVALEEKLGFLQPGLVLGWAGDRSEAVKAAEAIKSRNSDGDIAKICQESRNNYFIARYGSGENDFSMFLGPGIERIESGGFEFYCAGSGARILKGLKFTAQHVPLAEGAPDVAFALMSALARFMAEEMAGQSSQFYSLRTGGHYQILYNGPDGVRRLHFCVNHWRQGDVEPLVQRISIPLEKNGVQIFLSLDVHNEWKLEVVSLVALAPLLQSPRVQGQIEITQREILESSLAQFTFHVCRLKACHKTFVANLREPQIKITGDEVRIDPYDQRTQDMVKQLLQE